MWLLSTGIVENVVLRLSNCAISVAYAQCT